MSLADLIRAVEAGNDNDVVRLSRAMASAAHDKGQHWPSNDVFRAYLGSVDAALALHNAVLPGWVYRITGVGDGSSHPYVHVFRMRKTEDDSVMGANSSGFKCFCPARAWLLAILRALEAEAGR